MILAPCLKSSCCLELAFFKRDTLQTASARKQVVPGAHAIDGGCRRGAFYAMPLMSLIRAKLTLLVWKKAVMYQDEPSRSWEEDARGFVQDEGRPCCVHWQRAKQNAVKFTPKCVCRRAKAESALWGAQTDMTPASCRVHFWFVCLVFPYFLFCYVRTAQLPQCHVAWLISPRTSAMSSFISPTAGFCPWHF